MKSFAVRGIAVLSGVAAISVAAALAACGGKTQGGGPGVDSGGGSGSGSGGGNQSGSGGSCIEVPLSSFDTSCQKDTDCVEVTTGTLCLDGCLCGGSAINASSQAAWENDVMGLGSGTACPCPGSPPPVCVSGTCTLCEDTPGGCGGGVNDASVGLPDASAPQCVDVPLSIYTTACKVDADCTLLPAGELCAQECVGCVGGPPGQGQFVPVNVSGQSAFEQATAGFQWSNCACPGPPQLACVNGTCRSCSAGGCGDGG
jgi:hypothetical protein